MGLDMYLYRRRYVKSWDFEGPEKRIEVSLKIGGQDVPLICPTYIEEQVGYWRKANQIHGWFIQNCAEGVDNCEPVDVSREQLSELLDICKKVVAGSNLKLGNVYTGTQFNGDGIKTVLEELGEVIEDPMLAKELLPVTPGFFFGNYGSDGQNPYDKYYLDDIIQTIGIIHPLLEEKEDYNISYLYRASW